MKKKVIIIGSGASGISAALGFVRRGIIPTMIDVGTRTSGTHNANGNLYDYRKENDLFDLMIGEDFRGLTNVVEGTSLSPKLTTPLNSYIIEGAEKLSPLRSPGFSAVQSFAAGGLAAGWGAGLYRYNRADLGPVPLEPAELEPYYNLLSEEIGISGKNDDLSRFFGEDRTLLPPFNLSGKAGHIYKKYGKKRKKFNKKGVFIGYPRLGVLTRDHNGRKACDYSNFETWLPDIPWVYNPAQTLDRLIAEKRVRYISGIHIDLWERKKEKILLKGVSLRNNSPFISETDLLVVAAGTINTTKLVLRSRRDHQTRLKILDNPLLQVPLILPSFLGSTVDRKAFGMTNLNLVFTDPEKGTHLQGSIIELTSPPRSVFFENFPVSAAMNLKLIKMASPGILAMFLYYPSSDENSGKIHLEEAGELSIEQKDYVIDKKPLKKIAGALSGMGALTHPLLIRLSKPGYAIHYAGTLPMKAETGSEYESSVTGELHGEPGIYIADGASFSHVAAKNLSFTLMANAMRIADNIAEMHR